MKNDPLDWNGDHIHTNFRYSNDVFALFKRFNLPSRDVLNVNSLFLKEPQVIEARELPRIDYALITAKTQVKLYSVKWRNFN